MTEDKLDLDYEEIDTDEYEGFRIVDTATDNTVAVFKHHKGFNIEEVAVEFWKQTIIPEVGDPEEAVDRVEKLSDDAIEGLMDELDIPTGNPFKVDEDDELA